MTDAYLAAASSLIREIPGRRDPCCAWVALLVLRALGRDGSPGYDIGEPWWRDVNVWDAARPWSGPEVLAELGHEYTWGRGAQGWDGVPFRAGRWYACQGWRQLTGPEVLGGLPTVDPVHDQGMGHAWLWYATSPSSGVVLDSSARRGPRLGVTAYTGGGMPAGRPWAERVAAYHAGLAVAVLPQLGA